MFTDTIPYRHYHLVHHRKTQQPDDPDLHLSAKFPISKSSYRRKFIRDITGQTGFKIRRAQIRNALGKPGTDALPRASPISGKRMGGMVVANLMLLAILTAFGKPHYYLMFWVLPLITWQMVVTRIRNIAEHAMVPDNNDLLRNARTTYASWWERVLFAPYWVNYHVDHHLLFYVPCYNLPKLHALLLEKGLGPKMEIQTNYATMLSSRSPSPNRWHGGGVNDRCSLHPRQHRPDRPAAGAGGATASGHRSRAAMAQDRRRA